MPSAKLSERVPIGPWRDWIIDQLRSTTIRDLARRIGCDEAMVRRWHAGKYRNKGRIFEMTEISIKHVEDMLVGSSTSVDELYPNAVDIELAEDALCPRCDEIVTPIDGVCPWCEWKMSNNKDVLNIDPSELRDTIHITIDRELIDTIDQQRAGVSRSAYLEMVLSAALEREHPHLPDDWTPERTAERLYDRLNRYLDSGR